MSMMRLLSAGRSLVGSRDAGKRLQMVDVMSLPKFGPKPGRKHPTSSIQPPEKVANTKPEAMEKNPSTKLRAPEKLQEPSSKIQSAQPKTAATKGPGWMQRIIARAKGLVSRRSKIPARALQTPVQGELSLDKVKVLRNDLTETDYEIMTKPVAAKMPVGKPAMPLQAPAAPAEANRGKIWNRVTTLIGAGHS